MKAVQSAAALVEGSGPACSSGKRVGKQGFHPIRAQRRGKLTRGGGQSSAPGLYTPKRGCQMAWSSFLYQHWNTTGGL